MSILQELLFLKEMTMSALLRSGFRPYGTFEDIFGDEAEVTAAALDAAVTDKVYRFEADNPARMASKKGILAAKTISKNGNIQVILAPGKVRVIALDGNVYSVKKQIDRLVEHETE